MNLNYYFFHTMHHEFCHILTQKKDYDPTFRTISGPWYRSGDWINVADPSAAKWGFVSAYSTSEFNEDFAEIYSTYVTITPEAFNLIYKKIEEDKDVDGANPKAKDELMQKVDIVKKYMAEVWGIDMDTLRSIILRRGNDIMTWTYEDLVTLK